MYKIELSVGWRRPFFPAKGDEYSRRIFRNWLLDAHIDSGDFAKLLTLTLLGFYVALYVPVFWKAEFWKQGEAA